MHFLITLVASVFVFGLALLFHEAGHFATAKKCGIQVNEFSIGMGPALFSRVHGGTQYSLRLLPIGGYVSMEGEDGEVDPDERPEGASGLPFGKVSIPRRVLVVAAGALMNFVLGFLVLLIRTRSSAAKFTAFPMEPCATPPAWKWGTRSWP